MNTMMGRGGKPLSPAAKMLLKTLDAGERDRINKCYPVKEERDRTLRELRRRGVKATILSEISWLSTVVVSRITKGARASQEKRTEG